MIEREECGRRLRAAREQAGLTQEGAAVRLGIGRESYSQYELGRRVPSWTQLYRFLDRLDLDPHIVMPEYVPASKRRHRARKRSRD